jgi:hypothetical protein
MKRSNIFWAVLMVLSGCASAVPEAENAIPAREIPKQEERGDSDDRLGATAFSGLPGEAREYLAVLSRAFREQDAEFLLAQGESQFEAELKGKYDDGSYLARLFRTGSYASQAPRTGIRPPSLDVKEISHIEYTDWEDKGAVLEIHGKIITKSGQSVPCAIFLLWRLIEPKILGAFP